MLAAILRGMCGRAAAAARPHERTIDDDDDDDDDEKVVLGVPVDKTPSRIQNRNGHMSHGLTGT